ncbi:hypothetical protein PsYK624_171590 [Phanerochaete sordida]|uniref:Uncharacterized protein n=1 Tax=Phanerochaete sordida TaxID=48140 RepID=A0A9P3LMT4_9APHY|nr:hypothetical protein PsYK624_171590 [Phanerochaete sordida]
MVPWHGLRLAPSNLSKYGSTTLKTFRTSHDSSPSMREAAPAVGARSVAQARPGSASIEQSAQEVNAAVRFPQSSRNVQIAMHRCSPAVQLSERRCRRRIDPPRSYFVGGRCSTPGVVKPPSKSGVHVAKAHALPLCPSIEPPTPLYTLQLPDDMPRQHDEAARAAFVVKTGSLSGHGIS